jgi:hypothetical protein
MADNSASTSSAAIRVNPRDRPLALLIANNLLNLRISN